MFCLQVLWMSHARSGTESRERKENPITAVWSNCVCSHQEFAGTSWRKWVWWRVTIQAVGLDFSPWTRIVSWQRRRHPWNKHLCQTWAPGSASPHPQGTAVYGVSEPAPLCAHVGLLLALCLRLFSGTENSGNKIPSPDNRPIQLQIPLCLCQQRTPNAKLERVAASKPLLPFPLNSPSVASFRMKLLMLSLSPKDLFRTCWIFFDKIGLAISDLHKGRNIVFKGSGIIF